MTNRRNMATTPRIAPVGSPREVRRSGRAWNARYRYDEPSTRTNFDMILTSKIPEVIDPQAMYSTNGQEAWRVVGVMSEFALATPPLRGRVPPRGTFVTPGTRP